MENHDPQNEKEHAGSKEQPNQNFDYFWGFQGHDFIKHPGGKIYEPIADRPKDKRNDDSPYPLAIRVKRDFFDLAVIVCGWLISLVTLCVIGAYTYAAYGQWEEMRKATNAATDASQTAACALSENRWQFDNTLRQMQGQTSAQQEAANASRESARAMGGQVAAANEANSISKLALDAQTRPWVGIEGGVIPVPDTQDMRRQGNSKMPNTIQSIDVQFKMENYGGSVATPVATDFALYNGSKPNESQFDRTKVCESSDSNLLRREWYMGLVSIFPKQITGYRKETAQCASQACGHTPSYLAACISYQRDQMLYHTRLLYVVEYADADPDTGISKIMRFNLIYTSTDAEVKQQTSK